MITPVTRTVHELAEICGATLEGDGARRVVGPASLSEATGEHVSFLGNPRYARELESTRAAAVVVPRGIESRREDLALLLTENPNRAFSLVIEAFRPAAATPAPGVHERACVSPEARLASDASVGPHATVGAGAVLEAGVVVHAGAVVGAGAHVGERTVLHPGVVLYPGVEVGRNCVLHAGAVIGADGFGFDPGRDGWEKVPQCGTVVVEDEVEIGANTTIDRGRFGATRIGRGAKLDNLVHIAHNVTIGPGALLVAQVGISGSSKVGARAVLGGQVGVVGHVEIGDGARIGGKGGVTKDVPGGKDYQGFPVRERSEALRTWAYYHRLPELAQRLKDLERRVRELDPREGGEEG